MINISKKDIIGLSGLIDVIAPDTNTKKSLLHNLKISRNTKPLKNALLQQLRNDIISLIEHPSHRQQHQKIDQERNTWIQRYSLEGLGTNILLLISTTKRYHYTMDTICRLHNVILESQSST